MKYFLGGIALEKALLGFQKSITWNFYTSKYFYENQVMLFVVRLADFQFVVNQIFVKTLLAVYADGCRGCTDNPIENFNNP